MNKLLNEKIEFKGKRFGVVHKEFLDKNGKVYTRDIVEINPAVVILPITSKNEVIFIKQFREAIGEETFELPAGIIEDGEKPEETAKRELEEETGIVCNNIYPLIQFYSSAGFTNEKVYAFVAKDLEYGNKHLDEDEHINEIVKIPFDKCLEMLKNNFFKHANLNIALLMYNLKKDEFK